MSTSLVGDDPILTDAVKRLLDAPALPSVLEGVLYFGEAGWHDDDGIDIRGIRIATYFDELHATNGALRFVPSSNSTAPAHASRPTYGKRHRKSPRTPFPPAPAT